ncbi:MAG TPA: 2Fe-2S iron-sulfur cluster binding domain-containing protein [Chloroflexi bacterium]|nr:2Fe-2S iron-sulfur cluster binding domain-containing protein [Chloroflexota bacterium]
MPNLQMTVNGEPVSLEVPAHRSLAQVLRYDLGLTGTKIGCNEAECGLCTVLVNGDPILSCVYPALKAQGAEVLTIEGLAQNGTLHPLQWAFIEHGAVQCGFCTPGLIMTAKALLDTNPHPDEAAIRRALKDTYCRCTGYASVIRAILAAAGRPVAPLVPETRPPLHVIGRPLPRPDAVAKVTGAARFTDDYTFPGMLYGATLRAGIPHARIRRIVTNAARTLPGVHAVLTAKDVPGRNRHGLIYEDWPVLCDDKVRYVGDAVAIVAAETPEIARQALERIQVEYEPLPVVADAQQARQPDAPLVHETWPTGNLLKHIRVRKGEVETGFAQADIVIERHYDSQTTDHAFMEPECAIARLTDDGRVEVYVGSQIPYADRRQIAAALGVPEEQVRVVGTLIGGGFGGKEDIAGQIHAALLARATGRPVKILYSRHESLLVHPKRHATTLRVRLGARRDGQITAVDVELVGDTGAYASLGDKVMTRATTHASGPYDIPHVRADCYAMYTNNPPAGAFRGFGVTQSCFAIESAMDELAEALGMGPILLRRKNLLRVGSTTCTGQVLRESVGLEACLDAVVQTLRQEQGLDEGEPIRWGWREGAKAYGWGLALAYKNTGLGGGAPDRATAEVEAYEDGHAEVRISSAEMGQGLPVVLAAIAAEELGLPFERVTVLLSDTDRTPDGGPTTASRQTYVSGNATRHAARRLRDLLAQVASERLDVPPEELRFRDGRLQANGQVVPLGEVVRWAREEGREPRLRHEYHAPPTRPLGEGGDMHFAFSFAAQAALVEVDTETGEVRVLKVIAAHDVGRAINPLALEGQIEGGIVMGLGHALTEVYILEEGVPYTQWFARYRIPNIQQAPEIISLIVEDPTAEGPYGAKGVGELPSIPTPAAIVNAIYHATGVRIRRLPVDQEEVKRRLGEATADRRRPTADGRTR